MAFEDVIKAHTEALTAHTAALEKFVKASGGAAAPAAKAADKPAKPAAAKKTEKPLVDQIAEVAGAYLKAGDADDRKAAAANIKKIVAHYGADRLTSIDTEHHEEVLAHLKAFAAGEEPDLGGDGGEESLV